MVEGRFGRAASERLGPRLSLSIFLALSQSVTLCFSLGGMEPGGEQQEGEWEFRGRRRVSI